MKIWITALFVTTTFVTTASAQANVVESHLRNIQDRVRACSVLPYSKKDNQVAYHNLISHCPEVRVVAPGKALVKIGGTTLQAMLISTEYTDGDIYDVLIRDPRTHDQFRMRNVMAFGDILLGILGGSRQGLQLVYQPIGL